MNARPAGLSLCMIVRDEERFLDGALRSVAGVVDDICVVDTGSSDATVAIARAHGARVAHHVWRDDFADARNAALALATRRWIVVLDADERLAPESRDALAAIGRQPADGRGRWITCRNLTDACPGSGALSNALVRIFPNDPRIRYRNPIHEFVARDGFDGGLPADRTTIEIVHHGYLSDIVRERGKGERNLRLARLAAQRDPSDGFHHYNVGMAALLTGDRATAIAALERMRDLTQHTPRGYRAHGLVTLAEQYAEQRADFDAALVALDACLALVPTYANAHFARGRVLAARGDRYEARNAFGRAIEAGAHDAEHFVVDGEIACWKAHAEIAATLEADGRFADALAWYDLASAARPAAQPLVFGRARCHEALGRPAEAGVIWHAACDAFGDEASTVAWVNFLLRHGRAGEALSAIDRSLHAVAPATRPVLLAAAAAEHLRAGDRSGAERTVRRALDADAAHDARATIAGLAAHWRMPELAALLPADGAMRATGAHIAYVGPG